jgi:hypothetical protein
MTADRPIAQIPSQPLEPEAHRHTRAPYTPPTLEAHGVFLLVTGCSLPGGLGCLPFDARFDPPTSEHQ